MKTSEKLEKLITRYATSYYSGYSEVSDEYFDNLVESLREIKPDSKVLTTPGWGYSPTRKVKHWFDLTIEGLPQIKAGSKIPSKYEGCRVSAKLDGLSVVSYYINGIRVQSITRGNGSEGKDVTDKIDKISPESRVFVTSFGNFTGAIRGEVVMPQKVWKDKYESLKSDNPSLNSRNIASGLMNRDEVSEDLCDLKYVVYKILYNDTNSKISCTDDLDKVLNEYKDKGEVVEYLIRYDLSENNLKRIYDEFNQKYPCDGLVLTKCRGEDSNYVIYDEVKYKFQAESKEVVVKDITYHATRTGRLAPLIWFNPVELSGAMVQKCTGFNAKFISDNGIGPGAVIEVCRSNEVIPYVMNVIDTSDVILPKTCPNCGNDLVWSGVDLICDNENESQLPYNFISTVAQIDGAGSSLYSRIVKGLELNDVDDLCDFLSELRGGISSVTVKLRDSGLISGEATWCKVFDIYKALISPINPVTFLVACNIKGLSWTSADTILKEYPDLIRDVAYGVINDEKLYRINGVGYSLVSSLHSSKERVSKIYTNCIVSNYEMNKEKEVKFKVAITGALSVKRSDFDKQLSDHGIEQSGNFKELKYLITNNPDSTSSKMNKAKENGVEIISEAEFVKRYFS